MKRMKMKNKALREAPAEGESKFKGIDDTVADKTTTTTTTTTTTAATTRSLVYDPTRPHSCFVFQWHR
ncbi:hypothetical protein TYRP_009483 [Tyrophagus putrescentiae]|nr:hypothetical protein TYRP_009483 [Tyrophagus putrescentiae]